MSNPVQALTHRQKQVVEEVVLGNHPSKAATARKLGIAHQTLNEHLQKPQVIRRVSELEKRRLDKANGQLARIDRFLAKAGKLLDNADVANVADPVEAVQLFGVSLNLLEKAHELQQKYGIGEGLTDSQVRQWVTKRRQVWRVARKLLLRDLQRGVPVDELDCDAPAHW